MKKRNLVSMIALSLVLATGGCTGEKNPKSTTEGATQNVAQSTAENTIEGTAAEIQAKWINDTWFPDEVFRSYIRDAFDENEDNILDKDEIFNAQELDLDYLGIKSVRTVYTLTVEGKDYQMTEVN